MLDITPRHITIAVAFPIVIGIFIILGILILRKDRKYWGNRLFALFFWLVAVGLSFNLSYLFSDNEPFIIAFNIATIVTVNFAILSIFLGILVIYKGEDEVIHNNKTILLLALLIVVIIGQIFIPGVTVIANFDPSWMLPFGAYELIFSQIMLFSVFYISFIFYRELTPEMKRKFRRYLIGLIFLDITLLSITVDNLNVFGSAYATIGAILNFCVVIGAILIYFGIVRR